MLIDFIGIPSCFTFSFGGFFLDIFLFDELRFLLVLLFRVFDCEVSAALDTGNYRLTFGFRHDVASSKLPATSTGAFHSFLLLASAGHKLKHHSYMKHSLFTAYAYRSGGHENRLPPLMGKFSELRFHIPTYA
jgi:hypothetical protein